MKFRPSTILALVAIFAAVTGTATAASGLINGKNIKPGTVTAKQFKNKSITKSKVSVSSLGSLVGAKGSKGETGAVGSQGPAGLPGTTPIVGSATKVAQVPNQNVNQVVLSDLPGSRYVATAKVNVVSQTAGSEVKCTVEAGNGGGSDEAIWTNPANNSRGVLWMVLPTQVQTNQIKLVCSSGNSSATIKSTLTAVPAI